MKIARFGQMIVELKGIEEYKRELHLAELRLKKLFEKVGKKCSN